MKRILTLFLCALLFIPAAFSEAADEDPWGEPCIGGPREWSFRDDQRSIVVNRYQENGMTWFVADVQLKEVSGFHAVTSKERGPLSELVGDTGAVLAINADNWGSHPYGVIIRDGQILRAAETTRHMLMVCPNGELTLRTDRKDDDPVQLAEELIDSGVMHTFEFGPALVEDGQPLSFPKEFDLISVKDSRKEPRTAIGMISPLHYVIIVVDGRQPGYSDGCSLSALRDLFVSYGAKTAINLDGGGSSTLWFMGEVLNSPAEGHERRIYDGIWY